MDTNPHTPGAGTDMTSYARPFWRLLAVGGAVAVGLTTHDAGFTAITLLGGLALPRLLGLPGGRHHMWAQGCAGRHESRRSHLEERLGEWHRQAHGDSTPATPATPVA